jgi:hypothetical protein
MIGGCGDRSRRSEAQRDGATMIGRSILLLLLRIRVESAADNGHRSALDMFILSLEYEIACLKPR